MSDYGSVPPPPPPPTPMGAYGAGGYGAQGNPPPNYLAWAILSTVLCFLPLGVVSIVYAAQVNNKWAVGDVAGAQDSSENARKFAIWAAIAWFISVIIIVIFAVLLGGLFAATSTSSPVN